MSDCLLEQFYEIGRLGNCLCMMIFCASWPRSIVFGNRWRKESGVWLIEVVARYDPVNKRGVFSTHVPYSAQINLTRWSPPIPEPRISHNCNASNDSCLFCYRTFIWFLWGSFTIDFGEQKMGEHVHATCDDIVLDPPSCFRWILSFRSARHPSSNVDCASSAALSV